MGRFFVVKNFILLIIAMNYVSYSSKEKSKIVLDKLLKMHASDAADFLMEMDLYDQIYFFRLLSRKF